MIDIYAESAIAHPWIEAVKGQRPIFACVLGFTETGLIPGISAAGATPDDRRYTAIADAEFLHYGPTRHPVHPLPPLDAGASPVLISRAVVSEQSIPTQLFSAGLPCPPAAPHMDLGGCPARCVSSGCALDATTVHHLFQQGLEWGTRLAASLNGGYLILGECVVGGTTTALAVLKGLGWAVDGKVNSSHPTCNHQHKQAVVAQGLKALARQLGLVPETMTLDPDPFTILAGVGDPMQVATAGMTLAASRQGRVMLAGGTQMMAVYAVARAIAIHRGLEWHQSQIVVGTTRWVAADPTGDTVGLATLLGVPLVTTRLSFATSQYAQLRAYERGFVKEGVGAGACAIASHLYQKWTQAQLLSAVEQVVADYARVSSTLPYGCTD